MIMSVQSFDTARLRSNLCFLQLPFRSVTFFYPKSTVRLHVIRDSFLHFNFFFQIFELINKGRGNKNVPFTALNGSWMI